MTILSDLIAWCDEERRTLRTHLQLLENGTMRTGRAELGGQHVDTTAEAITRTKKNLAELDAILARMGGRMICAAISTNPQWFWEGLDV